MVEIYQITGEGAGNRIEDKKGLSKDRKTYTHEEAIQKAVRYFGGDELAAKTWVNKYALKDSYGNIYESSPEEMYWRLAYEIERIENKYPNPLSANDVYSLIKDFRYIVPQGGPMSGIGNNYQVVSLSNCFVVGNEADSYGGIIKTDQEQVQLMKRRGGVGHDLSHIRPSKARVMNSALTSTGVVPFMERFSNSTREVAQDGRRGALMLTLSIKHPDAEGFIDAKMTPGKVTGANVSVKIDDEFMDAIKNGKKYVQQYPVNSENPSVKKEIDAKKLWEKIVHNAWQSAEPGVLFWDTITNESVPDCYADKGYRTTSTNPCGEIPLCPYDSCRLLAINLYSYVEAPFTDEARFNWDLFKEHSHYAQRIMDDIIDLEIEKIDAILKKINNDPENEETKVVERKLWEKIKQKAEEGRRTGIGITGEGDMLAALGITYGSDESIEFSSKVHKTLALESYRSSVNLAKERGAFAIYDSSKEENSPFIKRLIEADPSLGEEMRRYGRRNISLLTVSPTGTVSIMTQTTSGLEPAFLLAYRRRRKVNPNDKNVNVTFVDGVGDTWEEYHVFHHKFKTWLKAKGYDVNEVKKYGEEKLNEIIKKSPYNNATSNNVNWLQKVKLQGAVQKWVDHSISVTINLPKDASEDLVNQLYITAWEVGCKGATIYRDGSREGVLLSGKEEKKEAESEKKKKPKKEGHPEMSDYYMIRTGHGPLHIHINYDEDGPTKVFANIPPVGTEISGLSSALAILLSKYFELGGDPARVLKHLNSVKSEKPYGFGKNRIDSIPNALAVALKKHLVKTGKMKTFESLNGNQKKESKSSKENVSPKNNPDSENPGGNNPEEDLKLHCPNCFSSNVAMISGCSEPTCFDCGYSKCS